MILPFVRDLFADVERIPAFSRVATHLKSATGRVRVSGLTPTAKALLASMLQKAAARPLILIVQNNRAAEAIVPVIQGFAEITGDLSPDSIVHLPAYDVLPFENLSPHAEIQEDRARALWRITTGEARLVVTPINAALMRLQPAEFYFDLAQVFRRGETVDIEKLTAHLNTVGYTKTDVVEMPGEYALRGGILDVYPSDSDRPMRVELFGDEVDSIRKFDPQTQRSSGAVDECVLLPLTDTPVREELLAVIHTRLSGHRVTGDEDAVEDAIRSGGITVFPGWESYAPVASRGDNLFTLIPNAAVLLDEPSITRDEADQWWERVNVSHERSGVGNLVRPEDLYSSPDEGFPAINRMLGADLEHLGIGTDEEQIVFPTQPTMRFHGSIPAVAEEVKKLSAENQRVIFACGTTGEVERLAEVFTEYGVSFRLGSRTPRPGETYIDDAAYLSGEEVSTTIVKAFVPEGVAVPDARLAIFGARDLFDESGDLRSASGPRQIEDLRLHLRLPRSRRWRLRRSRRARHRPVPGTKRDPAVRRHQRRVHDPRVRRGCAPLRAAHAPRPRPEIPLRRRRRAATQPARHHSMGKDQS